MKNVHFFCAEKLLNVLYHSRIHRCLNIKLLKVPGKRLNAAMHFVFALLNMPYHIRRLENLAWATAQIHCYCTMAEDEKSSDSVRKTSVYSSSAETALNSGQNDGDVVLSTEPKILFCDLGLLPGDTKSCKCFETASIDTF